MSHIRLFFLVFLSFAPVILFSQSNFQSGLIVTANGDTVRGFVDHQDWTKNPRMILFKKNQNDAAEKLTPSSVKFLEVEGDSFLSYLGSVSMDQNSLKAADVPTFAESRDTVFLKVIATGEYVDMYQYRDKIKTRFFLSVRGRKPEELIYRYYVVQTADGRSGLADVRKYREQLMTASSETGSISPKLKARINSLSYTASALTTAADMINSRNGKLITSNKSKKSGLIWYAGVGANITGESFAYTVPRVSAKDKSPVLPYVNLGFDLLGNKDVGKIAFRGEISLGFGKIDTQSPSLNEDYKSSQTTAGLGLQVLYNLYNTKKLKFYLAPGLRINHSFYSNSSISIGGGGAYPDQSIVPIYYSLVIQGGVMINQKIEFMVSYAPQIGQSTTNFPLWENSWTFTRIGVNYHFSRQ